MTSSWWSSPSSNQLSNRIFSSKTQGMGKIGSWLKRNGNNRSKFKNTIKCRSNSSKSKKTYNCLKTYFCFVSYVIRIANSEQLITSLNTWVILWQTSCRDSVWDCTLMMSKARARGRIKGDSWGMIPWGILIKSMSFIDNQTILNFSNI